MVVGNGMLAKRFSDFTQSTDVLVFASGVSDSSTRSHAEFEREKELLLKQPVSDQTTLIYFSTCSIYDESLKNQPYITHKLEMEKLIAQRFPLWLIFRLSNPIGFTGNTHTVFNYFINHIVHKKHFYLWTKAERNILDIDDMYKACLYHIHQLKSTNRITDIANPTNYKVQEIVNAIEHFFGISGNYTFLEKGGAPEINHLEMKQLFQNINISFDGNYLVRILNKYFNRHDL